MVTTPVTSITFEEYLTYDDGWQARANESTYY